MNSNSNSNLLIQFIFHFLLFHETNYCLIEEAEEVLAEKTSAIKNALIKKKAIK